MALSPRLDLRQTQGLVVTPLLQQAIKLLQLSSVELALYVDRELEANPLLEVDDHYEPGVMSEALGGSAEPERPAPGAEITAPLSNSDEAPFGFDGQDAGTDDDSGFASGTSDTGSGEAALDAGAWSTVRVPPGMEGPDIERAAADSVDLRGHLVQQMNLAFADQGDKLIGGFLIEQLDESGYLTISVEDAARQLGCTADDVTRVLDVLQTFDPAGIFARDLKECLKLQLQDRNRFDPAMETLIAHLDLLGIGDVRRLREICRVSQEDIQDMIGEIRALDPKPALRFEKRLDESIVPDVIMSARSDGGWRIELKYIFIQKHVCRLVYLV